MTNFKIFLFYVILCACSSTVSGLLYFLGKEWIIIRWPSYTTASVNKKIVTETMRKKVRLFFWYHNRWNHETAEIVWSDNSSHNIQYLINSLLTLLEEEQIVEKKVSLQSVAQTVSENDIYLSFDRTPFNKEGSTHDKLMIVESILKTLRENNIATPNVYFLVHHQPMKDLHVDFSHAWPLEGFLHAHKQ